SRNGGKDWIHGRIIYDPYPDLIRTNLSNGVYNDCQVINCQMISTPNKRLLCAMSRIYAKPNATDSDYINDNFPFQYINQDIVIIKSKDQGTSWTDTELCNHELCNQAKIIAKLDPNNAVFTGGYIYNDVGKIVGSNGYLVRTTETLFSVAINKLTGEIYLVYQT